MDKILESALSIIKECCTEAKLEALALYEDVYNSKEDLFFQKC